MSLFIIMRICTASCILALPSAATTQSLPVSRLRCTISSRHTASNATADDAPAIAAAWAKCASNVTITFAQEVDYNVFAPIAATNLGDVTIEVLGNIHLPQDITYVHNLFNSTTYASSSSNLYCFVFAGSSIHYVGSANITSGSIDSYGQAWWDANTSPGTGLVGRPHLMQFNTKGGSMHHFKSRKPIAWNVQLQGSNIEVSNTFIDAYSTTRSFPFNTDGFDVGGTNVTIRTSVIYDGDDAIAVQSGAHNVLFKDATIGYQSHGMSIGSLGQNQAWFANVINTAFDNVDVINAVYAARFKSWQGGQGLAKNISWTNIRVYNVTFPIFVTQTYVNQGGSPTKLENGSTTGRPNNSTVNMEDFTWANFTGTLNTIQPGDGSCVTDVRSPRTVYSEEIN